jgi:hypothetical protein
MKESIYRTPRKPGKTSPEMQVAAKRRGRSMRPIVRTQDPGPLGAVTGGSDRRWERTRTARRGQPSASSIGLSDQDSRPLLVSSSPVAQFEDDHGRLGRPQAGVRVDLRIDRDPALPEPISHRRPRPGARTGR